MNWSAKQYSKYEQERNRPIHDLLSQLNTEGIRSAMDLGCGPGNSTEILRARLPAADISGLDSSEDMLAAARKRLPGVTFEAGDISQWKANIPVDVILSNAALQWVPDHERLLPALLASLTPGGQLAAQMPDNLDEPAHKAMRAVASDARWADRLKNAARPADSRHSPDWYYKVLRNAGASVNVWRTVYHHALAGGPAAIVEWFKGSALGPFLKPLNEEERELFLARYEEAVAKDHPTQPDGTVLLPFPRLFFVATRE
ncbi:trans-aconitate 2-methyltransferase [Pseudomonas matsuisoli]|nr:trans-aconitate 2-methyltransferase [Pseudomonas matsuisoli]